jgi:hypothetical protein
LDGEKLGRVLSGAGSRQGSVCDYSGGREWLDFAWWQCFMMV